MAMANILGNVFGVEVGFPGASRHVLTGATNVAKNINHQIEACLTQAKVYRLPLLRLLYKSHLSVLLIHPYGLFCYMGTYGL